MHVLSQVISAVSSSEQHWSTHWHIHSTIRNRPEPATTEKHVLYCNSNSKMVEGSQRLASSCDANEFKMLPWALHLVKMHSCKVTASDPTAHCLFPLFLSIHISPSLSISLPLRVISCVTIRFEGLPVPQLLNAYLLCAHAISHTAPSSKRFCLITADTCGLCRAAAVERLPAITCTTTSQAILQA